MLESAARFRRLNPGLPVLGVEIDPLRVAEAQPHADTNTFFRLGGFNLPLEPGERVRLIRALNLLRQYSEQEVPAAHAQLGGYLLPGGLLVEGTSDPFGRIWVANLLRKRPDGSLAAESLVLSTSFRWGFRPELSKNYIHRMVPGEPIHAFFEAWKQAFREALPHRDWGLRQHFVASAEGLAARGYAIDLRRKLLARGYLLWKINQIAV